MGSLVEAFEVSVSALGLADCDAAAVEAGRVLALRIDSAVDSDDALLATKTLYLMPHLLNVLRELGATPASRGVIASVDLVAKPDDELEAFRKGKKSS